MTRDERDWASFEERIRNTMWGNTQHTTKIEDGLVFVETASHGGLVMDFAHYQKLPHDVRSYIAPGGFAEEDCNAGIVLVLLGISSPFATKTALWKNVLSSLHVLRSLSMGSHLPGGTPGLTKQRTEDYASELAAVRKHVLPKLGEYVLEFGLDRFIVCQREVHCTKPDCSGTEPPVHSGEWVKLCHCIQETQAERVLEREARSTQENEARSHQKQMTRG